MADDPITAKAGETVSISLPSGGGTGYTWKVIGELPHGTLVSNNFVAPDPSRIGGMGTQKLDFVFPKAGKTSVQIGFVSPTGDVDDQKSFSVEVKP